MGILLEWQAISTSESDYDQVAVYRATSEDGTYVHLVTQDISDTTYYDADGTSSSWYKLKWYDSTEAVLSEFSEALKGGEFYGYCSVEDVRDISSISSSQLNDTEVAKLIIFASNQMNAEMQIYHEDEAIGYIDSTKENTIDGSNTTFYTKHYPIGDLNNDYNIDENDIEVYQIDSDSVRTQLTVSSVTASTGKFVLSSAPNNVELEITYKKAQLNLDRPSLHPLVKTACALLASAWGFGKLNIGKAPRFKMGNQTIYRDTQAHREMLKRYNEILMGINDRQSTDMVENLGSF